MSFVAPNPRAFLGQIVGDGQCVAYVKAAAGCPQTSKWTSGAIVKGSNVPAGTAIATFQDGDYGNHTDGRSHAAIFLSQDSKGLVVLDQWNGQVVHQRTIRFKGGNGEPRNDGDAFSVIEDRIVMNKIQKASAKASKVSKRR
ncbi:MAG: BPSL0067 family protein [Burkholderiales bacterium]|nr:BPSL0067 family protein [Burkholderiales bacterium]